MKINSAHLFGICFILSFVTYATGTSLTEIIQNNQTLPTDILENKVRLVIGAILMAVVHTLFNLGLLVVMYTILKSVSQRLSVVYLLSGSLGTLMLALGAVFLLLPVSIGETIGQSEGYWGISSFSILLSLSSSAHFYSYQLGMIFWGCGGMVFCYLLQKSGLVPVAFPVWGYIGYAVFIAGCLSELFGIPYGVVLSIPGGLFEIVLSIWLIAKGFNNTAADPNVSH